MKPLMQKKGFLYLFMVLWIQQVIFISTVWGQSSNSDSIVLIQNANIFNGKDERISKGDVLIEGPKIKQVSSSSIAPPSGATVIDGNGLTLMPGMIDAHWHTSFSNITAEDILVTGDMSEVAIRGALGSEKTLMRGFTTVRDVGGNPFTIKKMIDGGELVGPRIYPSGPPISQTAGHFDFRAMNDVPANNADPLSYWSKNAVITTADGVPEVLQRVRENLRMGATQIKLAAGGGTTSQFDPLDVQQFTFEEVKAAVQAADAWNTYVTVHAYTPKAIKMAIDAGVKCVEHGQLLDDETMQLLKEKDIWLCLQPFVIEDDSQYSPNPITRAKQEQMVKGTGTAYELAKKHKVKVGFGTDIILNPEGTKLQGHNVALLTTWYSPYEALKMVTYDNAQLLKLSGPRNPYPGDLGIVKQGAYADLILVKGNPLEHINLVADPDQNFVMIMKGGKIYKNTLKN